MHYATNGTVIKIKSNTRILVVGRSGSGKTTFTTNYLWNSFSPKIRKIFIDPKHEAGYIHYDIINTNCKELESDLNKYNNILYMPSDVTIQDFDKLCSLCYNKGNIVLFIDESAFYCTSSSMPKNYRKLMIMGRSRGIGVVNTTQRPHGVNQLLISEAEHLFIFNLNLKRDKDKLKAMIPFEKHPLIDNLSLYHFLYCNLRDNQYIYFKPLKIKR